MPPQAMVTEGYLTLVPAAVRTFRLGPNTLQGDFRHRPRETINRLVNRACRSLLLGMAMGWTPSNS